MPGPPGARETGDDLRVDRATGVSRGAAVDFRFDGEPVAAFLGESVAAALLASGRRVLRTTAATGAARGVFCGMGVCYDCLVQIDGQPSQRACMVEVRDGLEVRSQAGPGAG